MIWLQPEFILLSLETLSLAKLSVFFNQMSSKIWLFYMIGYSYFLAKHDELRTFIIWNIKNQEKGPEGTSQ